MISSVPSPMRAGAYCMRIPRPDVYLSAAVGSLPTIGAFRTSFASEDFPTCACRQLSRICGTDRWTFDHEEAFSERLFVVNFGLDHLLGAYCYLIILAQGKTSTKTGIFLAKRCARRPGRDITFPARLPPRFANQTEPEMIAETFATALYCWRSCPEHLPPFSALRTLRAMARANAIEGKALMYRRIVVKLGTGVLTKGTRFLNQPQMVELTRQIASLHHEDKELIICTSGAQAAGRALLDFPSLPSSLSSRQMLAAVGQSRLMLLWGRFFEIYGILVGQILLTRADTENRHRFLNARDTFNDLIKHGIVPVVNENDAVAVEEIKVGDNDNLSALVAVLTDADLLLMLTDQQGLFTADPRTDPNARLIPEVQEIDDSLRASAGSSQSGLGIGGMSTKLEAADIARRAGTDVVIAAGSAPDVILQAVAGEQVGTRFPAQENPLENRKRWILAGPAPSGCLMVDSGAAKALRRDGNSLLPVGITAVEGEFERGDAVFVRETNGPDLARGITRYSSNDLNRIRGCQSHAIGDQLGYDYGPVVLHRNDMIVLE